MIYNHVSKIFVLKSIVFDAKNNYFVKGTFSYQTILIIHSSILFSGSAKSNRVGFSATPGSPQEPHEISEQRKTEPIYSLSTNPSSDLIDNRSNMPTIEEHENIGNSEDEDEQAQIPIDDDGQTDVQEEKLVIITTEINAKQKCLEMLENARKRSDLIRQRYEERLKLLSERIQNAEDEKQAAVTKLSSFILISNSFQILFFLKKVQHLEINIILKN